MEPWATVESTWACMRERRVGLGKGLQGSGVEAPGAPEVVSSGPFAFGPHPF